MYILIHTSIGNKSLINTKYLAINIQMAINVQMLSDTHEKLYFYNLIKCFRLGLDQVF